MFDKLKLLKLRFILRANEKIRLPEYTGSTFRGAFGIAFKKAVCILRKESSCENCLVNLSCAYYKFFESPVPGNLDNETLKFLKISKVEKTSHPFIFEPDLDGKRFLEKGDTFYFDLLLFGRAIEYYPYFVYSISEMGKIGIGSGRGKFEINNILNFISETKTENAFDSENNKLSKIEVFLKPENKEITNGILSLKFVTPLRLQIKGELQNNIEFSMIVINLIRKISTIMVLHYDKTLTEEVIENARDLINKSYDVKVKDSKLDWYSWERWSSRQQTKMDLGGIVGDISFFGDLKPFSELINLGKYFHLGKNTVFGLGKYEII